MRRFLLSIMMLVSSTWALSSEAQLRIASSEWAPYKGQQLQSGGVAIEITRHALERAGYPSALSHVTWQRALTGANRGDYDVLPATWATEERKQHLNFSSPILDSRLVVIWRSDFDFKFNQLTDLQGHRVGVGRGWAYPNSFSEADYFQREPQTNLEASLRMLLRGRLNIIVGEELAAQHTLSKLPQQPYDKVRFSTISLQEKPLRVAFSRKLANHEVIVRKFDQAILAMKADGSYQDILHKHRLRQHILTQTIPE